MVESNTIAEVDHGESVWPYPVFELASFPETMTPQQAFGADNLNVAIIPTDSKIEIIHRSEFKDPDLLKRCQGPGDWFWRWKSLPDFVGRMYGFATPQAAAIDGVWEELAWKKHLMESEGMQQDQWPSWMPGQKWERR